MSSDKNWADEEVSEFLTQISAGGDEYRRMVERLPVIVYSADLGPNGRWRYVSPQIEEILGYTPQEWRRDPGLWARCLHPEDRSRALAQESLVRLGDRDPPPVDYRMITRSGDVVWILDEAVLEPDASGAPVWHGVLYDITERKTAEQSLQRALSQQAVVATLGERALRGGDPERLMEAAVRLIGEVEGVHCACIWELGRDGRRLYLRAGLKAQVSSDGPRVSAARDSHAGAALEPGGHAIVPDWQVETAVTMPPALRAVGAGSSLAVAIDGKDGPFGVLDVHALEPHRLGERDLPFVRAAANVLADAIERHTADEALRHRVMHDALTGLPNRLSFIDALSAALGRASLTGMPVGVLFLDLDHFKLINDSRGHHAGDVLLRAIAPRLRDHLRPGDIVARFGGDEFGVLVDRLSEEGEALAIAERVRGAFSKPFLVDGAEHSIGASIGVAVARPAAGESGSAELLIRDADAAMYRAKETGRGRCVLFDAEMRAGALRRIQTERELRGAVERDELVLHYQPVVSLSSCEIAGLEALIRWRHPVRGLLGPGEFIPVAEESGLIDAIGRWVQERACRQLLEWQGAAAPGLDIAVNLSARQVVHRDLAAVVADVLARTGLSPDLLRLEITESVLVEESATATATLERLSELGVRLVLDDFGTGYSSLAYLNRYPFDALKIDRSFVEGLGVEQERTAIVEAIVAMSRALSLDVIAEGVENEVQLSELRRLGCDFAQGHLFHRAMPAAEVAALLGGGARPYSGISPGR